MKNIVDIIRRQIFGYDIFISYSRNDGLNYSYAVAQHFLSKGYECYIDQLSSTSPGSKLPKNIKHAVKRSTAFVLVGSTSAQTSAPISLEIQLFIESNKNKPMIPISIDGTINEAAIWFDDVQGLALIDETKNNLNSGSPSKETLNRIENALNFTKKSDRLRRTFITTLIAIAIIIGFALYFVYTKGEEANQAMENSRDAKIAQIEAEKQKEVAEQDKKIADQEVIEKTEELANLQTELDKKTDRLTTLDTELSNKQKELVSADFTRRNVEGNAATLLSLQRTKEQEALYLGVSAVTSAYATKTPVSAQKGLSDAYHNYLVYRPIAIDNIKNIIPNPTNSSLVCFTQKDEVFMLDSKTTNVKNKWKIASARGSIDDVNVSDNGQFLTYIIKPEYNEAQQEYVMVVRNTENENIIFSKSSEEIISYKLSPKGTYILINTLKSGTLWNIKTNTKNLIEHKNIKEAHFSKRENTLVTFDKENYPKVWSLWRQVTFMHEVPVDPKNIATLHVTSQGGAVIVGQIDNEIAVWRINNKRMYPPFKGHSKEPYFYIAKTLNEGDKPEEITRDAGGYLIQYNNLGINDIDDVKTRTGYRIVTASNDQSAILWSQEGHLIRKTFGHEYEVEYAKFSNNGRYLATASKEKVLLSDAANGRPLDAFENSEHEIKNISFLDKNKLVIVLDNGISFIWTFFGDTSLQTFQRSDETIASAQFTKDNKNIITTDWNGNISLWDKKGKLLSYKRYKDFQETVNHTRLMNDLQNEEVDFQFETDWQSGNNRPLYEDASDPYERIKLDRIGNPANPKSGERPMKSPILSSIMSSDGKNILCQNSDGVGIVYRIEKDSIQFVCNFYVGNSLIQKAIFIKNGTEIAIKPMSSMHSYIIDAKTGQTLKTLPGNEINTYDKTNPLRVKAEEIIKRHFHPNPSYRNFKITPDNKHFITVGFDRMVHLFRLSDGAVLSAFRAHTGRIYEVTISNDGNYFLTIGEDRTAKLFKTPYLNTIKKNAKELLKN